MVREALDEHGGNLTHAARALGVSRFGLQKMVKRLGIERLAEVVRTEGGRVLAVVGRGADLAQAAVWAMHLHAGAGDALTARVGAVGFLARELVEELPQVLHQLSG